MASFPPRNVSGNHCFSYRLASLPLRLSREVADVLSSSAFQPFVVAEQESLLAVSQVHAVAIAIAEDLAVCAFAGFHP